MSADHGSKPDPRESDLQILPLASPIDRVAQEIKTRQGSGNRGDEDAQNPQTPPSHFQRFMHKHFPEAKAHDRWTLVFTAVIAVSTALYTMFAGWTLSEIRSGGADTHILAGAAKTQAEKTTALAAYAGQIGGSADKFSVSADQIKQETSNAVTQLRRSADDTEKGIERSSKNAQRSLDASIEAARLDQRPWLAENSLSIVTFAKDETFKAVITFMNTGKTPASHVKICKQLIPANFDVDGPSDDRMLGAVCDSIGALPPQLPFVLTATDDPGHYMGALYDDIMAGRKFLFIWGKIIYFTSSARPWTISNPPEGHQTSFCFEFDRFTKQFGFCRDSSANEMN
jgi:hypothetical protein